MNNSPANQAVTYVPFGSFQQPTSPQTNNDFHMRTQFQDKIRNEVTSFDVKPLNPRPCFPRQAQVVPITTEGHRAMMLQRSEHAPPPSNMMRHPGMPPFAESQHKQDPRNEDDENFVYIHRQNSFIDVSQMTHRDHSNPPSSSNLVQAGTSSRSNDEVDAAMTLAKCLNS